MHFLVFKVDVRVMLHLLLSARLQLTDCDITRDFLRVFVVLLAQSRSSLSARDQELLHAARTESLICLVTALRLLTHFWSIVCVDLLEVHLFDVDVILTLRLRCICSDWVMSLLSVWVHERVV